MPRETLEEVRAERANLLQVVKQAEVENARLRSILSLIRTVTDQVDGDAG